MTIMDYVPLYYKLAEIIQLKIEEGEYKKGQMIPSERELCKIYDMSRITVRRAIDQLVTQGKLEKVQGKGTFVVSKSIVQNLGNIYSFSQEMEKQGKISSTVLVERKIILADNKLANHLGINENDEVIYIERLRCAEDIAVMVEKTYFKYDKYKYLMDLDLSKETLYKSLEEKFGVRIDKAIETFKACQLNDYECGLLNTPKHQYGLLVSRTTYSKDVPVCYAVIVSKGDTFEFTVKLTT